MNIQSLLNEVVQVGITNYNQGNQNSYCNKVDVLAFLKGLAQTDNGNRKRFFGAVDSSINIVEQQSDNGVMQYARPLSSAEARKAIVLSRTYKV